MAEREQSFIIGKDCACIRAMMAQWVGHCLGHGGNRRGPILPLPVPDAGEAAHLSDLPPKFVRRQSFRTTIKGGCRPRIGPVRAFNWCCKRGLLLGLVHLEVTEARFTMFSW